MFNYTLIVNHINYLFLDLFVIIKMFSIFLHVSFSFTNINCRMVSVIFLEKLQFFSYVSGKNVTIFKMKFFSNDIFNR